jgi:regulator of nucleoside diphosphate kinase
VVPRAELPPDVVTMNATVRLRDLETGEEETYTLVYPADADIAENKLSVLAPVGTALLGYRAGDVVEWPVPAGVSRFRIEEVLQPAPRLVPAGR